MSFKKLIFLELENFIIILFGLIPTFFGFIVRSILMKLLLKKNSGFIWVQPFVIFVHSKNISIGKNFGINSFCYINGVGGIYIGDNVLIGSHVTISSGKHPIHDKLTPVYHSKIIPLKITIEDDVWIGSGCVILPGVTIAQGTVVGANSTVTKNTKPYSVIYGSPAKESRIRC
jgi:maltose O-acetyltransferase